jgi:Spy/CpxP family protein refolding chaperone
MLKKFTAGMCGLILVLAMRPAQAQSVGQEAGQAAQQAGQSVSNAASNATNGIGVSPQVQQKLHQLSTELGLTDDQKSKIKPVLQNEFRQTNSVSDDTSMSQDQKDAKAKQIHESADAQIQSLLTPEQQTKLSEMKAKAMQR